MTDVKVYWRDKVTQLLGWSTGLLFIAFGWSMDQHDKFELGPWSQSHPDPSETRDATVRAIVLLAGAFGYAVAMPLLVRSIYARFLRQGTDETVLKEHWAVTYSIVISVLTFFVALLTALF